MGVNLVILNRLAHKLAHKPVSMPVHLEVLNERPAIFPFQTSRPLMLLCIFQGCKRKISPPSIYRKENRTGSNTSSFSNATKRHPAKTKHRNSTGFNLQRHGGVDYYHLGAGSLNPVYYAYIPFDFLA